MCEQGMDTEEAEGGKVMPKRQGWKAQLAEDSGRETKKAVEQYKRYQATDRVIHLQYASKHLFNAVENYIRYKYAKPDRKYRRVLEMIEGNKHDEMLLISASRLHHFYCNADGYMCRYDVVLVFRNIMTKLKKRIRRISYD